ncbi:MAG TPA: class I SAM-dependent methyltransferase [Pyrinomonadaceae bacterium]|nr:class I SAM-dependent methyltransferase [Pyrinomonadaceae bacterium]
MAVHSDNSTNASFDNLSSPTSDDQARGVIIDIGTGDGRFVYQSARENPARFYLGIDANAKPLEKISLKATRQPAKGGAPNLMFVQAAIEDLPAELNDTADEIHIHFPWGSLLRAVACGDPEVLKNLHRVSAPGCLLEVVIGIDPVRDKTEIARLELPVLSADYLKSSLAPKYDAAGFKVRESGPVHPAEWPHLKSSWARRLQSNDRREVVYFIAEAQK